MSVFLMKQLTAVFLNIPNDITIPFIGIPETQKNDLITKVDTVCWTFSKTHVLVSFATDGMQKFILLKIKSYRHLLCHHSDSNKDSSNIKSKMKSEYELVIKLIIPGSSVEEFFFKKSHLIFCFFFE